MQLFLVKDIYSLMLACIKLLKFPARFLGSIITLVYYFSVGLHVKFVLAQLFRVG